MIDIQQKARTLLKHATLNESTLSTILGLLVVLVVGILLVNYFNEVRNTSKITDQAASTENTQALSESFPRAYVVREGDSLWLIAETAYGMGEAWTDIAKYNNLNAPDSITVGMELTLPEVNREQVTQNGEPGIVLSAASTEAIKDSIYTVQEGDTLETIAIKAYGRPEEWPNIAQVNGLTNPDRIDVGSVLVIPR